MAAERPGDGALVGLDGAVVVVVGEVGEVVGVAVVVVELISCFVVIDQERLYT